MAIKRYNQASGTLLINGIPIVQFMDGTPITVHFSGGEVEATEGMDGAGINIATKQGGTVKFTLQEVSVSHAFLKGLRLAQETGIGIETLNVTFVSGGKTLFNLFNGAISQPGDLTTGGKKMAGQEYTIIGTRLEDFPT